MPALRNLQFSARLRGLSRDEEQKQIEDLLRRFDLWGRHTERPAAWSQGMRRRLALARALLGEPKLLLLDEPTNDLDPEGAWELRRHLVAAARERGVTVVVTTHRLREFEDAFDEVAILQKGRLLASGSTNDLRAGFGLPDGSSLESVYLHARGAEVRPR
jgi:ABC-type multidrug transport system ATPase subunit